MLFAFIHDSKWCIAHHYRQYIQYFTFLHVSSADRVIIETEKEVKMCQRRKKRTEQERERKKSVSNEREEKSASQGLRTANRDNMTDVDTNAFRRPSR